MRRFLSILLALGASAAQADTASYRFVWQGGGGYSVQGGLAINADQTGAGLVTEADVICFEIQGIQAAEPVGRWALGQLLPDTTWRLHFSPSVGAFFVEGQTIAMPQAWNMNGEGTDCGAGGFGLNIGNFAQDICIDGTLVTDSQVSPFQPFPAQRDDDYVFGPDACLGPMMLSAVPSTDTGETASEP